MKRLLYLIPFLFALQLHASQTWHVSAIGGGRYDAARVTAGFTGKDIGCDGLGTAAYNPAGGVNQHCPFDDYRFMFDDQTFGGKFWVMAGSDTLIIDNNQQWRVGFDQGASPDDVWCPGGDGNAACTNPVIPAGTSDAHTKILGVNFASCGTATTTDKSKLTQIFGGFGLGSALALNGAQFVDIECIEITRHSDCITHGLPREPSSCNTDSSPISDFDSDGITTGTGTHDLLLQDMWVHGHTDRGIIGPIGGLVTCIRCNIDTNGMAGWDFDDGGSTPSPNGIWNISYTTIQWSGCNQEYPFVDPIPVTSCYSQSTEGYGDGVGTPPGFCMNVSIDHSAFLFNTQDGLDLGHLSVVGSSGVCTLSITNSRAESNGGATFKWGAAPTNVVMINNLAKADCNRMGFPITGAPSSYNANLSDFCRSGDAFSFNMLNNGQALIANNTFVSYESTSIDLQCNDAVTCSGSVVNYLNNTFLGYGNPLYDYGGHSTPGGWCLTSCNGTTLPIGTINRKNNIYYQLRETCQSTEICLNPLLVDQPTGTGGTFTQDELDDFNYQPSVSSPAIIAGTTYSGQPTTDYFGNPFSSPLPIGAVEPAGAGVVATPTASPVAGTYTSTQTVTLSTATGGATICYSIDGSTPTATTPGTCDGLTYSTPLTVATTLTIKAIGTLSGDTNSGVFSGLYTITIPTPPQTALKGVIVLKGNVVIR